MNERFPGPASEGSEEDVKETLQWVAGKVLSEKDATSIEDLLADGEIERAKEYLLGRADRLFEEKILNFDQAAELYALIGVSPERASELRQRRALNL